MSAESKAERKEQEKRLEQEKRTIQKREKLQQLYNAAPNLWLNSLGILSSGREERGAEYGV